VSDLHWTEIAEGWPVIGRDGHPLGRIVQVVGDPNSDAFRGVTVNGLRWGGERLIPADRVARIASGRVEVAVAPEELARFDYAVPPRGNG
jgi:uncharacterized protein YrrD